MKYQNRGDLLIAAGESIKMQEKYPCIPRMKCNGNVYTISTATPFEGNGNIDYEFPLAVVEGKPVFVGDYLWCKDGNKHKIIGVDEDYFLIESNDSVFTPDYLSWNPPKLATVMVELLREDAEKLASHWYVPVQEACRKALESK